MNINIILLLLIISTSCSCQNSHKEKILETFEDWNRTLNHSDLDEMKFQLGSYYAKEVNFYGKSIPSSKVVENKLEFRMKYPFFNQKIINIKNIGKENRDKYVLDYRKSTFFNGTEYIVDSQLLWINKEDNWYIIEESDSKNISKQKVNENKLFSNRSIKSKKSIVLEESKEIELVGTIVEVKWVGLNDRLNSNYIFRTEQLIELLELYEGDYSRIDDFDEFVLSKSDFEYENIQNCIGKVVTVNGKIFEGQTWHYSVSIR
jgi:hypothetical protein